MPTPASGFARALAALTEAGVSQVVVGVGGINFYARTPAEAFVTLDLHATLEPHVDNLRTTLEVLAGLGYQDLEFLRVFETRKSSEEGDD